MNIELMDVLTDSGSPSVKIFGIGLIYANIMAQELQNQQKNQKISQIFDAENSFPKIKNFSMPFHF